MLCDTRTFIDKFMDEHDEYFADEDLSDEDHPFFEEYPWEVAIYNLAENDYVENGEIFQDRLPISDEMQTLCDGINAYVPNGGTPKFEAETGYSELGVPAIFLRSVWSAQYAYARMFEKFIHHRAQEGELRVSLADSHGEWVALNNERLRTASEAQGLRRELERQMES